jgi:hypothetical protein
MVTATTDAKTLSINDALKTGRHRALALIGQLERNQGLPTFTGRLTLEQFADFTVVHNRKWAADAGESLDIVTQREIIDAHANGLAMFMLQGLAAATAHRLDDDESVPRAVKDELHAVQDHVGRSAHYGLPQVTLVLQGDPEVNQIMENGDIVAARLFLPAGRLFVVADGQHRREAARKLREFLNQLIADRRIPKAAKFYPSQDDPLTSDQMEAWVAVQDTFRSWTLISYEAHIGLSVEEARQMFTNYNCHVKPVKQDLNLTFDQSNPINQFAKDWVQPQIQLASNGEQALDLRQLAAIQGFLFLGKTSIKGAPYNISSMQVVAQEFWTTVLRSPEWKRDNSVIREAPVLKGLAKAWFYVFLARRNNQSAKAERLRRYIRTTTFDRGWMESVPGLAEHTVPAQNALGFRFAPSHNEIVARIVSHIFE